MDSFNEIWSSSANNLWSFLNNALVLLVVLSIIALTAFNARIHSGIFILLLIFLTPLVSVWLMANSIDEKWRTRSAWVEIHWDELTADQQQIATTDGANLVLGPWLHGFMAFTIFAVVRVVAWLIKDRWYSDLASMNPEQSA